MQANNFKNLQDSENTGITLYYEENNKKQFKFIDLENESKKFTKVLINLGVNSSDNIVILTESLPQSHTAFWGCKSLGNSPTIIDPKKDTNHFFTSRFHLNNFGSKIVAFSLVKAVGNLLEGKSVKEDTMGTFTPNLSLLDS